MTEPEQKVRELLMRHLEGSKEEAVLTTPLNCFVDMNAYQIVEHLQSDRLGSFKYTEKGAWGMVLGMFKVIYE